MKTFFAVAVMLVAAASFSDPADAAGCIKGAVVGGIAGHYAGHHGLLGATGGCLVGRHYANKHAHQNLNNDGSGSSTIKSGSSTDVSQPAR